MAKKLRMINSDDGISDKVASDEVVETKRISDKEAEMIQLRLDDIRQATADYLRFLVGKPNEDIVDMLTDDDIDMVVATLEDLFDEYGISFDIPYQVSG